MKNIYKFLAGAVALTAVFSCSKLNDYPVFEDGESFAAFDIISMTVNEDAGTINIPVTIGSVDPKQVAVAYEVTDGTAKAGEDFSLADASAVLAFDGETRTMNIEINIVEFAGEYTGDKTFSVSLVSAGGLKLGKNSTCSVKIADLDHPLAAILGSYTASCKSYSGADLTWTLNFEKDPSDVTVVWVDAPVYWASQYASWGDYSVYGNVSEDMKTITFPCGQTCGALSDSPAWFDTETDVFTLGTWAPGISLDDSGVITMTMTEDGVWKTDAAMAIWPSETISLYVNMLMAGNTMVWTKQ